MIPVLLTLEGFLSYRDRVTLDLSAVEVACVSGANGAGKSSLFDAITWALFGKARRSDDALINDASESCLVALEFEYEDSRYRVQREKQRAKSALLEFQIRMPNGAWRTLTEAGLRLTEERIRDVLRLDYDTFINASFFLQGKADMFTQQAPARRKEILSSILGLEVWEAYKEEAALRRRNAATEVKNQRTLLDEIEAELAQEADRTERLRLLTTALEQASSLRAGLETRWENARKVAQQLQSEGEKQALFQKQMDGARSRLLETKNNITARSGELLALEALIARSTQVEKAFHEWQSLRIQLEHWNGLADGFNNLQRQRDALESRIQAESARLNQELLGLRSEQEKMIDSEAQLPELRSRAAALAAELGGIEEQMAKLQELETRLVESQNLRAELGADYRQLSAKKAEAEGRRAAIASTTGSTCPLCGQDLDENHRSGMQHDLNNELARLEAEIAVKTDQGKAAAQSVKEIEAQILKLKSLGNGLPEKQKELGGLHARVAQLDTEIRQWHEIKAARLNSLAAQLSENAFALEDRKKQQALDVEINALGYNTEAHEAARSAEMAARASEAEYLELEKARTLVEGLRRELATLETGQAGIETEIESLSLALHELQEKISTLAEDLPDLDELKKELDQQKSEENSLRTQTGAARQLVAVLEVQREKKAALETRLAETNLQIARLRLLENAFGRDGIPAMLIEQALPEIESQANEILDRLSDGRMSLTFETEKEYKDKNRDDKKPTLDILISDSAGRREYELFSGGEAFRINFAIRLALSRVLAGRAGARLRTLVIDEGFGSQDSDGIQRLIEAIRRVSPDFAKILVITHLDELKSAFPSRIEVTKTGNGSQVEIFPYG